MTFDSDGMKKNMAAAAEKINAPQPKPYVQSKSHRLTPSNIIISSLNLTG